MLCKGVRCLNRKVTQRRQQRCPPRAHTAHGTRLSLSVCACWSLATLATLFCVCCCLNPVPCSRSQNFIKRKYSVRICHVCRDGSQRFLHPLQFRCTIKYTHTHTHPDACTSICSHNHTSLDVGCVGGTPLGDALCVLLTGLPAFLVEPGTPKMGFHSFALGLRADLQRVQTEWLRGL